MCCSCFGPFFWLSSHAHLDHYRHYIRSVVLRVATLVFLVFIIFFAVRNKLVLKSVQILYCTVLPPILTAIIICNHALLYLSTIRYSSSSKA